MVPAAGGDPPTVRAIRHRLNVTLVAMQHGKTRLDVYFPESCRIVAHITIVIMAADRNQSAAVGGKHQFVHCSSMPMQDGNVFSVFRTPNADRTVGACGGDGRPVWA